MPVALGGVPIGVPPAEPGCPPARRLRAGSPAPAGKQAACPAGPVCAVPLMRLGQAIGLAGAASSRRQHVLCGAQRRALSVPDCLWGLEGGSLQLACSRRDSRCWDMAMGWLGSKVGEVSASGTGSRDPPDSPEDCGPSSDSAVLPAVQDSAASAPAGVAQVRQSTPPWPCLRKGACCQNRDARRPCQKDRLKDSAGALTPLAAPGSNVQLSAPAECPECPECQGCPAMPADGAAMLCQGSLTAMPCWWTWPECDERDGGPT